jgi:potassium channel subfamily K member 9
MIYAMIGIPLCLVMFQAVGERLNDFTSYCVQILKKSIRVRNIQVKNIF